MIKKIEFYIKKNRDMEEEESFVLDSPLSGKCSADEGEYGVIKYDTESKELVIPSEIKSLRNGLTYTIEGIENFMLEESIANTVESIVFPETLKTIYKGSRSCNNWKLSNLKSIKLYGDFEKITSQHVPFHDSCTFKDIILENNNNFKVKDGVLYNSDMSTLVLYPTGLTQTHFTIPDGVVTIENEAFLSNKHLKTVDMPETLQYIENYAFCYCENLEKIELPTKLKHIGRSAFRECNKIKDITIPKSIDCIENYAFYKCENLYLNSESKNYKSGRGKDWIATDEEEMLGIFYG